jgi:hypothetical protein
LPSRRSAFRWFVEKEWKELLASRAWWAMVIAIGPLVGVSFISAVTAYGELSGLNGTAVGVGEAFSPLVGIWAPTFSACELAAAFLLPFVAIKLVASDAQSGALKIEMQHGSPAMVRIGAKALVLLIGWLIATAAPLLTILLWKSYGGTVYPPELASVILGHVLNAGLTIALGAAAAAVTEHPSTAAIMTLTVTVGTWILNFVAAVNGGIWERAAGYTPTAMVAEFQRGLIRADVLLVAITLIAGGLCLAAIWIRIGVPVARRGRESAALALATAAVVLGCTFITSSIDLSESRTNSFPEADEAALRNIHEPIRVEVHLAPEDPRRSDLSHRALSKLLRVVPSTQVSYVSATTVGLFEQTSQQYGEIWYDVGGRRMMTRATTAESVLETIYALANITPPVESDEEMFRGHPLAARPRGAAAVFYGIWPAACLAAALLLQRSRS